MNWKKVGRTTSNEGTTITYWAESAPITIESRKRHIPHANGVPGTWDYTSYFVLWKGHEVKELHTLKDAKKFAEKYMEEK